MPGPVTTLSTFDFNDVLRLTVQASWIIFGLYTLLIFITTAVQHGVVIALIRLISVRIIVPLLIPIAFTAVARALIFVPPQEIGIVVSILSPGGIRPQPVKPGLHWIVPALEWEETYPTYWQTYTMSGRSGEGSEGSRNQDAIRARTSDGQEVYLDTSLIFRLDPQQVVALHVEWQKRYIVDLIRPVIRGVVRRQVSQFTVNEVNSSARKDLEISLDRILTEELGSKGLIVDQFLLRDITFTPEFSLSIEHKQIALENRERAIYEAQRARNIAEGEADAIHLRAKGEADAIRVRADAEAYALSAVADSLGSQEQLVTYRYVEKLAPNVRVMLVPSNAPFILPLPSLEENMSLTQALPITQSRGPLAEPDQPKNQPNVAAGGIPPSTNKASHNSPSGSK